MTERTLLALDVARRAGLSDYGILSTHEDGTLFRKCLEQELDSLPPQGLLRLDFSGVDLMDASFADAGLAILSLEMAKGAHKERYLLLVEIKTASIQNLGYAIDTRQKRADTQVRNLVLSILHEDGTVEVFGKLEEHLARPLDCARKTQKITARELASSLDMDLAAASTKLKTLYDLRLLRREELRDGSGKQFVYRFFT